MITLEQYLMGRIAPDALPPDHRQHALILLRRINKIAPRIEADAGRILKVNDGYRRAANQPKNAAQHSRHLTAQAIDIDDDDSAWLWRWCFDNLQLLTDVGLWLEDPRWTHGPAGTWMHLQSVPPASGRRIFRPSMAEASAPDLWDGNYDPRFNFITATAKGGANGQQEERQG